MIERIFLIKTQEQFASAALEVFRFQAEHCDVYAKYLKLIGVESSSVTSIEQIPMLPIELFKSHDIYSAATPPQMVFTSSATTGMSVSRHLVADLGIYERDYSMATLSSGVSMGFCPTT